MSANQVIALTYHDELPQGNGIEKITSSQKSQAKLLQLYLHRYQWDMNNLYDSYLQEKSGVMTVANKTLNQMSRVLTRIQNQEVDPKKVDEVIHSIIYDLRDLNSNMEIYLKQQEEAYLKKLQISKEKYLLLGEKITRILDRIVDSLSNSLIQKQSLNDKEKEIVRNLVIIRDQSNKIKEFNAISFRNEQEMQIYFKNIVQNVRVSLINIKSLAR